MDLRKQFKDFTSAFFEDNPNINFGGCGVFAGELGKDLQALGFQTRCIVFGYDGWAANSNLNAVASKLSRPESVWDWNDHDVTLYHVMLEVKGHGKHFLVDGEGVYDYRKKAYNGRGRYDGYIPVELMDDMTKDASAWNSRFPRRTIPRVRKQIKQFVEDLKNANL